MDMYRGRTRPPDSSGLESAGRIALSALVMPLVAAGSFLFYALRGPFPRIGGALAHGERRTIRRRLRAGLRLLDRPDGRFQFSEVVPFAWRSLVVVRGGEDWRDRFAGLAAEDAKRMARQDGDIIVLERAPGAYVWIALGPSPGIVGDGGLVFGASNIVATPAFIDGIRHLRLTGAGGPAGTPPVGSGRAG
jgi:hypothetical protein